MDLDEDGDADKGGSVDDGDEQLALSWCSSLGSSSADGILSVVICMFAGLSTFI